MLELFRAKLYVLTFQPSIDQMAVAVVDVDFDVVMTNIGKVHVGTEELFVVLDGHL